MRLNKRITILFIFGFFFAYKSISQSSIEYGSNNGKYIQINNTAIYYEEYGEGTATIMLHGGLGSISDFGKVIPELSKHARLIAVDSPSHGRSESIDSLSYQILANYIVEIIEKLKLDEFNIVGYSDGAIVGMLVANMVPKKIKKLVFGAGALNPKASKPEGLEMLKSITPEILPENFAIPIEINHQILTIGRSLFTTQKKCGYRKFGFLKKYCQIQIVRCLSFLETGINLSH